MLFTPAGWLLLLGITVPHVSSVDIPLTLYTDNHCSIPSTSAASISLDIGTCAATPGLGSFHLLTYPCLSGSVQKYVFSDTACGKQDQNWFTGECNNEFEGAMAAIMLSCNQDEPEQPSSFTTINVGPIATAVASAPPPATSETGNDSPSTTINTNFNSSPSSSTDSAPSSDSIPNAHGWESLSLGTKIGIIISLAVGVPPIIIGIITIRQYRKKQQQKRLKLQDTDLQSLGSGYPHAVSGFSANSGDSRTNFEHFHVGSGYPSTNTHSHPGMGSWRPSHESPTERWNRYPYMTGGGMRA